MAQTPSEEKHLDWQNIFYQASFLSAAVAIGAESLGVSYGNYIALASLGVALVAIIFSELIESLISYTDETEHQKTYLTQANDSTFDIAFPSAFMRALCAICGLTAMGLSMNAFKQVLIDGTDPGVAFSLKSHPANMGLLVVICAGVLFALAATVLDYAKAKQARTLSEQAQQPAGPTIGGSTKKPTKPTQLAPHPLLSLFNRQKLTTLSKALGLGVTAYALQHGLNPTMTTIGVALLLVPFLINTTFPSSLTGKNQRTALRTSSAGAATIGFGGMGALLYPNNGISTQIMYGGALLIVIGVLIAAISAKSDGCLQTNSFSLAAR